MKELKLNIQYLLKRKELYIAICIILLTNLIHVILCVKTNIQLNNVLEQCYSGEYQFILYNVEVAFNTFIIIIFPITTSLILADTSWVEKKSKTLNLLCTRLNYRKNIFVRFCLSIFITFIILFIGFSVNYLLLRIIFGSGNTLTYFQGPAYHLVLDSNYFLDNLRIANPAAFVFTINFTVSLLLSLLSGLSYLLSFFIKQRFVIYFISFAFLIITELIFPYIGFKNISYITMLQPFSHMTVENYISGIMLIIGIQIILLLINIRKKDILV